MACQRRKVAEDVVSCQTLTERRLSSVCVGAGCDAPVAGYSKSGMCKRCRQLGAYRDGSARSAALKRYGLTHEAYESMLLAQGGVCAICGGMSPGGRRLAVDHDHVTGVVRALLCGTCNTGLGSYKDDPALLRAAAVYLERF